MPHTVERQSRYFNLKNEDDYQKKLSIIRSGQITVDEMSCCTRIRHLHITLRRFLEFCRKTHLPRSVIEPLRLIQ
jgi:hypothetical protein